MKQAWLYTDLLQALKVEHLSAAVLNREDFNFCVRSNPLREDVRCIFDGERPWRSVESTSPSQDFGLLNTPFALLSWNWGIGNPGWNPLLAPHLFSETAVDIYYH